MRTLFCLSMLSLLAGPCAAAAAPTWYPPSEPSPFIPDAAQWIGGQGAKTLHFRGTWRVRGSVRRAVVMVAPHQTARLYLNGRLVLEAHDEREALPAWAEVGSLLRPGEILVAARVYSEWRPVLYAQMRVEYADGTVEDLTTAPAWEWCAQPGGDWMRNPRAAGDWRPVEVTGGYHRGDGQGVWGHDFALLPREVLRARCEAHNARLRALWEKDRRDPGLRIAEVPERPEWAAQFRDFCRLDEEGQLRDGSGRVRHLFFNIYRNNDAFVAPGWDFDQLERDLDLMARADVHFYLRNLGWNWLLTGEGEWAPLEKQPKGSGLPHFARGIDLLDYFVRRAWAHGRYVLFEGDFYWAAHPDVVPPPYRSRYHLYPEVLEAQALAHRRILHHFAGCTNVLGAMIGEEDIVLAHDLGNPHQHALFSDYLRRKYGTLERFRAETPLACDYTDRSAYLPRTRAAEYWPGTPPQEVLAPRHPPKPGVFTGARDWLDIPLPLWPAFHSPEQPDVALGGVKSYNEATPDDPLWIDFYEMREDELLFAMLKRWAEIVREGMPRQLLFYSNAQDFTNSWHFLHLYRRADLPFDVIGVGCHDSGSDLGELPAWSTVRKAFKVISSYRPYALAPGSPARGVASGEGEGGRAEHPEAVLDYYRGALFDEIGGGAAWTQTYAWPHVSGAEAGQAPHETPLLKWLGEFMPAVQGVSFPLRRPVQVLVVRTANLAHSNLSGLDYGNAQAVAEALTQLNVEFDVVMDRDLVYGSRPLKVDLSPYRLVILPSVTLPLAEPAWQALDAWLADPAHRGARVLALGRIGDRGRRLQPAPAFPPMARAWLGQESYACTVALQGGQELLLPGGRQLTANLGKVPPTGILAGGEAFLETRDGAVVARRFAYQGNTVVAFGFPLGFAHDPLWGFQAAQTPPDAVAPLYEALAREAQLDRPAVAPHNLRVYVSGDGRFVMIRERAGRATDAEVAVRLPAGVRFPGLSLARGQDGYTRFRVSLRPWEGRWWKAAAE